jgi:hypothetical protein
LKEKQREMYLEGNGGHSGDLPGRKGAGIAIQGRIESQLISKYKILDSPAYNQLISGLDDP